MAWHRLTLSICWLLPSLAPLHAARLSILISAVQTYTRFDTSGHVHSHCFIWSLQYSHEIGRAGIIPLFYRWEDWGLCRWSALLMITSNIKRRLWKIEASPPAPHNATTPLATLLFFIRAVSELPTPSLSDDGTFLCGASLQSFLLLPLLPFSLNFPFEKGALETQERIASNPTTAHPAEWGRAEGWAPPLLSILGRAGALNQAGAGGEEGVSKLHQEVDTEVKFTIIS